MDVVVVAAVAAQEVTRHLLLALAGPEILLLQLHLKEITEVLAVARLRLMALVVEVVQTPLEETDQVLQEVLGLTV
jgi:hypothetical protein